MKKIVIEFHKLILDTETKLRKITEADSEKRPAEGKWSGKEILGHLIDSSINNTARFVTGQFKGDLIFSGYAHNEWVAVQNYQASDWNFLIDLWKLNNLNIGSIINQMEESVFTKLNGQHNFDEIAWQELDKNTPTNLEYLFKDYVGHMKHHLKQLFKIYQ